MPSAPRQLLTEAEYLAFEEASPIRHEFVGGEVFTLNGVSQRHNRIAGNLAVALMAAFRGKPCQVFMSDVKLHIARDSAYYYPDVMVTCSEQARAANESQVVNDPLLVIEVISPSTEATDRREKLHAYRSLPALQEYALVSQDTQQVEIYRRQGEISQISGWLYITYEPGDTVEFAGVGVALPIAELYAGTDVA
ncbi:MAG: Uma2 family endonuclease [Pseudomonadota bacterium]|nr:Uma2 family endonuclease [Pseudomonadota bacterium]MDP1903931.1 Uma2 family endonuclease [Pseudomonadota bacterium]MDP2351672.1 Uma2 family endonuclease [Pseudomonadota bacterium]